MGRGAGPAAARDFMRILLLLSLLISGCSHTSVQGGWNGGTSSGGNVSVGVGGGAVGWALIGIGLIAAGEYSEQRRAEGLPPMNEPPRELDKARRVNEQDSSQPITDWSANLKCR
jgi:hypothetical protein